MQTMTRSTAGLPTWNVARNSILALALACGAAWAQDRGSGSPASDPPAGDASQAEQDGDVRALGGTSVIGNRELPKSLYIVPWKNSEVGERTDLSRDLLDEGLTPVDPNEFERQVEYYEYHQQQ